MVISSIIIFCIPFIYKYLKVRVAGLVCTAQFKKRWSMQFCTLKLYKSLFFLMCVKSQEQFNKYLLYFLNSCINLSCAKMSLSHSRNSCKNADIFFFFPNLGFRHLPKMVTLSLQEKILSIIMIYQEKYLLILLPVPPLLTTPL